MTKILVTGGCGYIGSHTVVDLIENGFEVVSIDNHIRSDASILLGMEAIVGKPICNYAIDLRHAEAVRQVFAEHPDIQGVIHFAAFKSVPESVQKPLDYYDNNLNSLLNVLAAVCDFRVPYFIFSSSCSVYGNVQDLPVRETTPFGLAESPYAHTKQVGEQICKNAVQANPALKAVLLRYFNPAGAHPSIQIGENPQVGAYNVVPLIMESVMGLRGTFTVLGTDYPTRDGSCVRDYIHVSDVAAAHTQALRYLIEGRNVQACESINVGLGEGVTVLELLDAFERATGVDVPRILGARRPGDVAAIYADAQYARQALQWQPRYSIETMMKTAWDWEQRRRQA